MPELHGKQPSPKELVKRRSPVWGRAVDAHPVDHGKI
jgi:hypothetical protein